jgi:thiamine-monophosphate kinase
MLNEVELIKCIAKQLPRSSNQKNKIFETDAEILPFGNTTMAITIDEFSDEDLFRTNNPYDLGWNMAIGGISDILACGSTPLYYAHSFTKGEDWDDNFVETLSRGVGDVLRAYGTSFIGGDFGQSKAWRYTATVIGEINGEPLKRSNAKVGDGIYITGEIGSGNLQAATALYKNHNGIDRLINKMIPRFSIRLEEAKLIRSYSKCCMDTSDGLLNGLKSIALSSRVGFEIENIPYLSSGILAAKLLRLPKTLLMSCESGEYELLFTVPRDCEKVFQKELNSKSMKITRIGQIANPGLMNYKIQKKKIDFLDFDISARAYKDQKDYIKDVANYFHENTESR